MTETAPQVVVVTGLSGAGKSTALHTLSDLGYYCVDNLPPSLVTETVKVCAASGVLPVALGLDVRVGTFLDQALVAIDALGREAWRLAVLFLDASDDVLGRRFSETRRPHPLLAPRLVPPTAPGSGERDDSMSVLDAVQLERERLGAIRTRADQVIDTSQMSVHDLRRDVTERFGPDHEARPIMLTRLVSFGFKYGIPLDADLVFDVRFLDNPYFVGALRERPGTDDAVRDFVLASPGCSELLEHLERLLRFALPRYEREGKSYLTIAIGCTGGRHRSVTLAADLARRLGAGGRFRVGLLHRDLARELRRA
jgi:RNase adapter protein RapZ